MASESNSLAYGLAGSADYVSKLYRDFEKKYPQFVGGLNKLGNEEPWAWDLNLLLVAIRTMGKDVDKLNAVMEQPADLGQPAPTAEPQKPAQAWVAEACRFAHEVCPECGDMAVTSCRCRIGDKTCKNGHHFATCKVHGKVSCVVPKDGSHPLPDCSCFRK